MRNILMAVASVMLTAGAGALAAESPPGASSCSGCHPAKPGIDTPVPRLNGRDAQQIVSAMQAFRSGQRPATVILPSLDSQRRWRTAGTTTYAARLQRLVLARWASRRL